EAQILREKVLGKEHPNYAETLINMALLYTDMGKFEKAEPLFSELFKVEQTLIANALHHLSEREMNIYLNQHSERQNHILSFAQKTKSKKSIPTCFDNSLFYKGFLLNAANQVKRLALSDSSSTEKYNRLKGFERRLAAQYTKPISERDSATVDALETQANDLEKGLARTVSGFGEAMRQVNWEEVRQNLKADEAAVEFVQYRYYDKKQTDSTMYAALLLRPTDAAPTFVSLCQETDLQALLQDKAGNKKQFFDRIYRGKKSQRGLTPNAKKNLKSLYPLIWQPLDSLLGGVRRVYYSPAGLLHQLNLAALPVSKNETLGDRLELVQLGSTRQLVVPTQGTFGASDAIVFGGIRYEADSTAVALADTSEALAFRSSSTFNELTRSLRSGAWPYLEDTEKEASEI
ncbi:MAG: hypothetical protein AAB316_20075, partial [Bacteroidota bacterium]